MNSILQKPKGTNDYFGAKLDVYNHIIKILKKVLINFNYQEIIFPTFEEVNLFERSLGKTEDIVNKEMFLLQSKGKKNYALRPEGTASSIRLILENKLFDIDNNNKYFYITNMFRYERPQKGRTREFFQLGIENFSSKTLEEDVQIFQIGKSILENLNITKYTLEINTIGSIETRTKYIKELKDFFVKNKEKLSKDSIEKIDKNCLRILDSKNEQDQNIIKNAPLLEKYLTEKEKKYFSDIKFLLEKLNINYLVNNNLVRGLDYYNDLVFEFVSTDIEKLGAKSTLIAGGKYDKLVSYLDPKKDKKAIGFALGIERLMLASEDKLNLESKKIDYFVYSLDKENNKNALEISSILRKKYIVELDLTNSHIKKGINKAQKMNSTNIIILGKETLENNEIIIKNLQKQKQIQLNIKEIKNI